MIRSKLASACLLALLALPVAPHARADGLFDYATLEKYVVRRTTLKRKLIRHVLKPDLQIMQVSFSQDQTPAFDYPHVHVLVRNAGQVPTGLFYVAVLYSRDGVPQAGVVALSEGLAPGESRFVDLDLAPQGGGLAQWHEITVRVDHSFSAGDPDGNVVESNEQNNVWGPIGIAL